MKFLGISSLVLAVLAGHAGSAFADNISVRLSFKQDAAGFNFKAVHAERGDIALSPGVAPDAPLPKWRVVAKNAAGKIVHEVLVRSGKERHIEVFNPNTGTIDESRYVAQTRGVFEVSVPFDADIASIEVLPRAGRDEPTLANPAPLATFKRNDLEQVAAASAQTGGAALASGAAVPTATTIINSGPAKKRMDYVFVGEGYTAAEMGKWHADAKKVIDGFMADPLFAANRDKLNVHRVDIASNESGVDEPDLGIYKDTAMDGSFNCDDIPRALCVNNDKVYAIVGQALTPDRRDIIIVVSNSERYGGTGGQIASLSMNSQAIEATLHEIGHTAFDLGDEYEYGTCHSSRWEPYFGNLTIDGTRSVKWGNLIAPATPVPTTVGQLPNGTVGVFEGGNYCPTRFFRPTENSRMRSLGFPWHAVNEAVAKEVFIKYESRRVRQLTQTGFIEEGGWPTTIPENQDMVQTGSGTFKMKLTGDAGTNFNLVLYKFSDTWEPIKVASSEGSASKEVINYQGTAGYYIGVVEQVSGSGAYTVTYEFPLL